MEFKTDCRDEILPISDVQKAETSVDIMEAVSSTPVSGVTPTGSKAKTPWPYLLPLASFQVKRQPLSFLVIALAAMVLALVALAFLLACILLASLALIPLLFASLLVTRLLQLFRKGDDYDKITQIKLLIRGWIFLDMIPALFAFYIIFVMESKIRDQRDEVFLELPMRDWFIIICVLYGFYTLSFLINFAAHRLPRLPLEYNESGLNIIEAACEGINSLIFLGALHVVATMFPSFRHKIFKSHAKRLVLILVLIVFGCNIITLFTHVIVWLLWKLCKEVEPGPDVSSLRYLLVAKVLHRNDLVYCANGLKRIVITILSLGMVLAIWFQLDIATVVNIQDFGTWTLVSLFLCSFLWLIKSCLVLSWDARAIFSRLRPRMLEEKKKLYFLGVVGRHKYDFFGLGEVGVHTGRRRRIKELLFQRDENMTMYDLQQVAQCFLSAKNALSAETYTSDILEELRSSNPSSDDRDFKKCLMQLIVGEYNTNAMDEANIAGQSSCRKEEKMTGGKIMQDWSDFEELLVNVNVDTLIGKTETWMGKAQSSCEFLANMLSSAREVVNCLDNIISALIVGVTLILWLLVTGLATTELLLLVTSPLLAATFIFGDTCKSLFQGIIFIYVVHPFDVGDLCTVDEKMMQVKSVGVWKTTFTKVEKVGIQEEIIYPTSELAKKTVVNYRTEFDWDDCVKFNVGTLEEKQIEELKGEIESYLEGEKDKFIPESQSVAILATGDNIRIVARFKYKMRMKGGTYFECLKVKDKLRSQFSLHVQNLLSKKKGSSNTSGPPGAPPLNNPEALAGNSHDSFEIIYSPCD